ncbi:hypothetical protein RS694_19730 [Rhodoferax saidenbachensis]|uniref:Uncharacterized protein n=1 Tax=Rhodoferax saidenbachensis TaxID=1484693 RepID=A0A1P8KF02_9BURK|nr:hypothetical protein RS694_19730 [Rhodoferax saidenbachensis]
MALAAVAGNTAHGMELATHGNTIVLSGPVTGTELVMVKDAFAANPKIDLVVLRNSHGGDAWTGYRVGELLRDAGVTTAVSGYCISSCSRMFLGGKNRLFTDDYPADRTYVGFHGHYDASGNLDRKSVGKGGLYTWILKYSDGKADPDLVMRWIAIEKNKGAANFFHPDVGATLGNSVFFCDGLTAQKVTSCEPIATNALDRGVVTDLRRIASPDQNTLPERQRAQQFAPSGYAALDDLGKLPLAAPAGSEQYQRYLQANLPRAFAVAPTRQHWAWVSGGAEDVNAAALKRCEERAKQACVLYSVDNNVVYR